MGNEEKQRYSAEELKEFEQIILEKLEDSRSELTYLRETLSKKNDSGTDKTSGNSKVMEDGAETAEKENMNQLAVRLQKFIGSLEKALMRIKNGTYGVCVESGKLISKERLRLVPHTQHSIEAKLKQRYMGIFDNSKLVDLVTKYIKTQLELVKLDIQERLEELLSRIFKFILAAFAVGITLLFLLLGLANFLNDYFESSFMGHICVSVIALIISIIIIYSLNKKNPDTPLIDLEEIDEFTNSNENNHE